MKDLDINVVNTEVNESNPAMSSSNDISPSNDNLPSKVITIESILAKAANEPDSKEAETGWESSLFSNRDKSVDFESYVSPAKLFDALKEGVDSSEVFFASHQKGLLHILQHCYGYFYMLKHDKHRHTRDLKWIDSEIQKMNQSSNVKNPLQSKIIKLAWRHADIDRKRISSYANLLNNAYTKGDEIKGKTDGNGCVLPKYFSEVITTNGGISVFSRISKAAIKESKDLRQRGFKNQRERDIHAITEAIDKGEFSMFGEKEAIAEIDFREKLKKLGDGEFGVVLVRKNKDSVEPLYTNADGGLTDSLLLKMYRELEKNGKDWVRSKKAITKSPYIMDADDEVKVSTKEMKAMETIVLLGLNKGLGIERIFELYSAGNPNPS